MASAADDLGINNIMTQPTKELCDQITASKTTSGNKVVALFGVSMLNYRGPVGDYAWCCIDAMLGDGTSSAFAFLAGICMGKALETKDANFWDEVILNFKRTNNL